jgi:hypothetical protein
MHMSEGGLHRSSQHKMSGKLYDNEQGLFHLGPTYLHYLFPTWTGLYINN